MGKKDGQLSKKKERSFFELLEDQCEHLVVSGKKLAELLDADFKQREEIAAEIHHHEHLGDEASHKLVLKVSKSFVTPYDRDDMYSLSALLDDCLDGIDEAADMIVLYKMGELPAGMHQQVELINACAELTARLPKTLAKRDKGVKDYWMGINRLENQGDQVYRQLLAEMFENVEDPMYAIKLKDVIAGLEATTDSFERLSEMVEAIILKES